MLRATVRAVTAAGLAVVALVTACSDADDTRTSDTTTTTTGTSPTSTTTNSSTTTTTEVPTPPTNPPKPDICEPDMGTTLQAQYGYPPYPSFPDPPPDWEPPDPTLFDWDGDGTPDTLTVADDTVTVDWGTGTITITDIQTDYLTRPAIDDDGRELRIRDPEIAALHTPAAVGDVTGDGHPDLIVTHGGHTAVLIGQGPNTPTQTLTFNDVGHTTLGWRSPPHRSPGRGGNPEDQWLVPFASGNVEVLWDNDRDGASEFRVARYFDRAGPLIVHFAGVACTLPET